MKQARERGVKFGAIQLVDSTHTIAHVIVKRMSGGRSERGSHRETEGHAGG